MEEVESKEVTSVYEAYRIYDKVERETRRPESDLPRIGPYLSGLLGKERHARMKDGMRVVGVWATKGVVSMYDQSARTVGGRCC